MTASTLGGLDPQGMGCLTSADCLPSARWVPTRVATGGRRITRGFVTGQVRRRGSSSFELVDQVLRVSHEALDDTPSLFFGSPDKRSDHHEIVCALNGAEAA